MGRVRTEQVKRIAQELVEQYPAKFNKDFENNKKLVETFATVRSTRLRNKIAGYITSISTTKEDAQTSESEEAE